MTPDKVVLMPHFSASQYGENVNEKGMAIAVFKMY